MPAREAIHFPRKSDFFAIHIHNFLMVENKIMTEQEFWDKFHRKHNPRYYYAQKKTKEEKTEIEKKGRRTYSTKRHTFPEGARGVD